MAGYAASALLSVLGFALFAWLIVYAGRRVGLSHDEGPLRLRGRLMLDPRRAVYLVEVGDKVLVVGSSEGGLSKLAELPREGLPEPVAPARSSFAEILAKAIGSRRGGGAHAAPLGERGKAERSKLDEESR